MHLHAAAARGDHAGIRYALDCGTDINALDSHGCNVLHHALTSAARRPPTGAPRARFDTVELLLTLGADPRITDSLGRSAIHIAASVPDLAFVELLTRHGGDARQVAASGYSTLTLAASRPAGPEKLKLLKHLISLGVDMDLASTYGESPLSVCLYHRDFLSLGLLLNAGANPAPLAWSPLHHAIVFGTLDEVESLATSPAAINTPFDRFGASPWLLAIQIGDLDKIEALARLGADLVQCDRHGYSALHLAAKTNSAAVSWLLEYGADPHAIDDANSTPLHTAAEYDSLDAMRHLLAAGTEAHRENTYHMQPINSARSVAALRLLHAAGADLDFVDGCGDWPLKNAAEDNDPDRVAWLLAQGAKVDQTSTGATALHAATQADAREVIAQLLAAGANPNAQDVDGWTPFFSARSREAIHLVRHAGGDPSISDIVEENPLKWLEDPILKKALTEPLP